MSDKIKPSEVSEVLQQQLQEVNGSQQFDEVGDRKSTRLNSSH